MGEEIQFEALAQQRFIDFADFALPGSAGIGHDNVHTAESGHDLFEGGVNRCLVSHVASDRESAVTAVALAFLRGGISVDIEQGDFCAGVGEGAGGGSADGAAGSGNHRDLAGKR